MPTRTDAGAQRADGAAGQPPSFFSAYNFHLNAARLAPSDPRFEWNADVGGDFDLIDYAAGRLNFLANYEVILGNEFRSFDPNQAIYTLDGSASLRAGSIELSGVFHHVSRHSSDRSQRAGVAWNVLGGRAIHITTGDRMRVEKQAHWGWVIARAFVDYQWEGGAGAAARYALDDRWALIGAAEARFVGVDRLSTRGTLAGGRAEAGVRVTGIAGALELFLAYERRIDANPFDRLARNWAMVGFRLLNADQRVQRSSHRPGITKVARREVCHNSVWSLFP